MSMSMIRGIAGLPRPTIPRTGIAQVHPATFVPAVDNPAYVDQLGEFNRLVAQGADPRDVWSQTGIYSGALSGNIPVAEISDHEADFISGAPPVTGEEKYAYNPLDEFFSHPELFEMYPRLAETNLITTDQTPDSERRGSYRPESFSGPAAIRLSLDEENPNKTSARSVLIHEGQHGVQHLGGMPMGISPNVLADLGVGQYIAENYPDYMDMVPEDRRLTEAQLEYVRSNPDFTEDDIYAYLFSPGEAMARATQGRLGLDNAGRRALYPEDSLDVPVAGLEAFLDAIDATK